MKPMKEMKIDFSVYILHALHVLHGKIKRAVLECMTLGLILDKQQESATTADRGGNWTCAMYS